MFKRNPDVYSVDFLVDKKGVNKKLSSPGIPGRRSPIWLLRVLLSVLLVICVAVTCIVLVVVLTGQTSETGDTDLNRPFAEELEAAAELQASEETHHLVHQEQELVGSSLSHTSIAFPIVWRDNFSDKKLIPIIIPTKLKISRTIAGWASGEIEVDVLEITIPIPPNLDTSSPYFIEEVAKALEESFRTGEHRNGASLSRRKREATEPDIRVEITNTTILPDGTLQVDFFVIENGQPVEGKIALDNFETLTMQELQNLLEVEVLKINVLIEESTSLLTVDQSISPIIPTQVDGTSILTQPPLSDPVSVGPSETTQVNFPPPPISTQTAPGSDLPVSDSASPVPSVGPISSDLVTAVQSDPVSEGPISSTPLLTQSAPESDLPVSDSASPVPSVGPISSDLITAVQSDPVTSVDIQPSGVISEKPSESVDVTSFSEIIQPSGTVLESSSVQSSILVQPTQEDELKLMMSKPAGFESASSPGLTGHLEQKLALMYEQGKSVLAVRRRKRQVDSIEVQITDISENTDGELTVILYVIENRNIVPASEAALVFKRVPTKEQENILGATIIMPPTPVISTISSDISLSPSIGATPVDSSGIPLQTSSPLLDTESPVLDPSKSDVLSDSVVVGPVSSVTVQIEDSVSPSIVATPVDSSGIPLQTSSPLVDSESPVLDPSKSDVLSDSVVVGSVSSVQIEDSVSPSIVATPVDSSGIPLQTTSAQIEVSNTILESSFVPPTDSFLVSPTPSLPIATSGLATYSTEQMTTIQPTAPIQTDSVLSSTSVTIPPFTQNNLLRIIIKLNNTVDHNSQAFRTQLAEALRLAYIEGLKKQGGVRKKREVGEMDFTSTDIQVVRIFCEKDFSCTGNEPEKVVHFVVFDSGQEVPAIEALKVFRHFSLNDLHQLLNLELLSHVELVNDLRTISSLVTTITQHTSTQQGTDLPPESTFYPSPPILSTFTFLDSITATESFFTFDSKSTFISTIGYGTSHVMSYFSTSSIDPDIFVLFPSTLPSSVETASVSSIQTAVSTDILPSFSSSLFNTESILLPSSKTPGSRTTHIPYSSVINVSNLTTAAISSTIDAISTDISSIILTSTRFISTTFIGTEPSPALSTSYMLTTLIPTAVTATPANVTPTATQPTVSSAAPVTTQTPTVTPPTTPPPTVNTFPLCRLTLKVGINDSEKTKRFKAFVESGIEKCYIEAALSPEVRRRKREIIRYTNGSYSIVAMITVISRDTQNKTRVSLDFYLQVNNKTMTAEILSSTLNRLSLAELSAIITYPVLEQVYVVNGVGYLPPATDNLVILAIVIPSMIVILILILYIIWYCLKYQHERVPTIRQEPETLRHHNLKVDIESGDIVKTSKPSANDSPLVLKVKDTTMVRQKARTVASAPPLSRLSSIESPTTYSEARTRKNRHRYHREREDQSGRNKQQLIGANTSVKRNNRDLEKDRRGFEQEIKLGLPKIQNRKDKKRDRSTKDYYLKKDNSQDFEKWPSERKIQRKREIPQKQDWIDSVQRQYPVKSSESLKQFDPCDSPVSEAESVVSFFQDMDQRLTPSETVGDQNPNVFANVAKLGRIDLQDRPDTIHRTSPQVIYRPIRPELLSNLNKKYQQEILADSTRVTQNEQKAASYMNEESLPPSSERSNSTNKLRLDILPIPSPILEEKTKIERWRNKKRQRERLRKLNMDEMTKLGRNVRARPRHENKIKIDQDVLEAQTEQWIESVSPTPPSDDSKQQADQLTSPELPTEDFKQQAGQLIDDSFVLHQLQEHSKKQEQVKQINRLMTEAFSLAKFDVEITTIPNNMTGEDTVKVQRQIPFPSSQSNGDTVHVFRNTDTQVLL